MSRALLTAAAVPSLQGWALIVGLGVGIGTVTIIHRACSSSGSTPQPRPVGIFLLRFAPVVQHRQASLHIVELRTAVSEPSTASPSNLRHDLGTGNRKLHSGSEGALLQVNAGFRAETQLESASHVAQSDTIPGCPGQEGILGRLGA